MSLCSRTYFFQLKLSSSKYAKQDEAALSIICILVQCAKATTEGMILSGNILISMVSGVSVRVGNVQFHEQYCLAVEN